MRKIAIFILSIMLMCSGYTLLGCSGGNNNDVELDPEGNITGGNVASIDFWGWGSPEEVEVFSKLVEKFNKENPQIKVKYVQKASDGYSSATAQALSGRTGPDVVYVGDGDLKQWAGLDLLTAMDEHFTKSTVLNPADMWDSSLSRYRYDKATQQSRPTDPLYAVPKDIGPTVIYYNSTNFKNAGIEIISVDASMIDEYNSDSGKNYPKRGYFERNSTGADVSIASNSHGEVKVFNNRIPMTWEETVKISKLFTKSYNSNSPSDFGYFTEWWFNYGWGVGGDCITFNEKTSKWEFSLGNATPKKNSAGETMPSMLDAFTHFISLSQPKGKDIDGKGTLGVGITPSPDTLSTVGKVGYFTSGKVSMMVDGRWATVSMRKNIKNFNWDVAPLPKAKNGIESGHSGSMGLGISAKSKVKNAAWKFCEFIAGEEGQKAQSETGFNIPNQKSIAATNVFLQPTQSPKNSIIFLRAAEVQRPGDWTYLPDSLWIEKWAPTLNDDVRNGKINLTQFFERVNAPTNKALESYTK